MIEPLSMSVAFYTQALGTGSLTGPCVRVSVHERGEEKRARAREKERSECEDQYIPLNPVSGPEVAVTGGDARNGPRKKRVEKRENEKKSARAKTSNEHLLYKNE